MVLDPMYNMDEFAACGGLRLRMLVKGCLGM